MHGLLTHLNLNSTYLNGRTLVFKGILARYLRMLLWFPKMFTEAPAKKSKAVRRVGQKESKELNLGFCPVCWQKWERESNSFLTPFVQRVGHGGSADEEAQQRVQGRRNREILVLRYCEMTPWLALGSFGGSLLSTQRAGIEKFSFLGIVRWTRDWHLAIKRLRTRSAAVHHLRGLSLIAYERDLVTNEKV